MMIKLKDGLIFLDEHGQVTKVVCIIVPIECYRGIVEDRPVL